MRLWKRLQYFFRKRKYKRKGRIYHEHFRQIIVSPKELEIQLQDMGLNRNLIFCLVFGQGHPEYPIRLAKVCLKFGFISSLFYPIDREHTAKLPKEVYERLFDDSLDSEAEAALWLNDLGAADCSAKALYQKYIAVKEHCLRMLSSEREVYFPEEYHRIIDYIARCELTPTAVFGSAYEDLPNLPLVLPESPDYSDILD